MMMIVHIDGIYRMADNYPLPYIKYRLYNIVELWDHVVYIYMLYYYGMVLGFNLRRAGTTLKDGYKPLK